MTAGSNHVVASVPNQKCSFVPFVGTLGTLAGASVGFGAEPQGTI
jgi:hypothetical protein